MPILKFPENCSSASIGSLNIDPDENGLCEIPNGIDFSELLNHGFTVANEKDIKAKQKLEWNSKTSQDKV